ncbi:MAG: tRNA (guanine(37)-N(1))-methyltransferase [Terracidiphilus sp.]
MRFDIVTIFPGFFSSFLENGILRRAIAEGLVEVAVHDLRAFTHDRHRTVDDRPFGGGEGMVLKPQPIAEALASLGIQARSSPSFADPQTPALYQGTTSIACPERSRMVPKPTTDEGGALAPEELSDELEGTGLKGTGFSPYIQTATENRALAPEVTESRDIQQPRPTVILLSAQGRPFTQSLARELASLDRVVLICGRYEGVDERINQLYCDMELSIGDYVLSGGELAAAVVIDAAMRLIPGVLGNEASSEFESFGVADLEITTGEEGVPRSQHGAGGLLDYPHYTRPAEFHGLQVPETLLNGDHQAIRRWRREQQLRKTLANRPDLLENATLSKEDLKLLDTIRQNRD